MKSETKSTHRLRQIFGGALMFAGASTLMISPAIVGRNPIPEGVLIFGLVSILAGWVLMLTGKERPDEVAQPSMGD